MATIGRTHHGSTRGAFPALCAICGVPWERRVMRLDGGGRLVCPDDFGKDATTLDKLNARAARRRREPRPMDGVYDPPHVTPASILGDDLHSWFRSTQLSDVALDGEGRVISLRNLAGEMDLLATAGRPRPWRHSVLGDHSAIVGDASAWLFNATLTTPIAAGSRPYLWFVARADTSTARVRRGFGLVTSDGFLNAFVHTTDPGNEFAGTISDSIGVNQIEGPAVDSDPHLFELGFLSVTAGRFKVDGVSYDGSRAQATHDSVTRAIIASTTNGFGWDGPVFEMVVSSGEPSAAVVSAMQDYFAEQYTELSIA